MPNKIPMSCIKTIKAPISQLTIVDNYYMFGWQAYNKYDSCFSLKDYMQVSSNARKYLRTIALEGSIRLN